MARKVVKFEKIVVVEKIVEKTFGIEKKLKNF